MMQDATTCDNAFGFGRTVLDRDPILDRMTSDEYVRWCYETYDVRTREQV